jgi:hypothetical protein
MGKAPLSGLTRSITALGGTNAKVAVAQIERAAEITRGSDLPRITRLDLSKAQSGLKSVILTPTTSSRYYYENFHRHVTWNGRALWRDYVYAVTYYALVLASRNARIRKCGITRITDYNVPLGLEHMVDAIRNFFSAPRPQSPITELVLLISRNINPLGQLPPPRHEEVYHALGKTLDPSCEYLDLQIRSPALSQRTGSVRNEPDPNARK